MTGKAQAIQIDNGGIQYRKGDQVWTLVSSQEGTAPYELQRRDGVYIQFNEEYDTRDEAIRSAEEIAPLSEWTPADW